jgi:hypothetical protein
LEENEEGLDEDLDGFVVRGDDEIIGEAEDEMRRKYQQDLEEDDRRLKQMVMNAAIFGVNKKRTRQEADLAESDDEFEKRKQERIRERINSQEEAEMEQ